MSGDGKRRVAIACQGGGSHTAFTARVLKELLTQRSPRHEFVAFSGTSGGAICALLAWYGLLKGDAQQAARLLDEFWTIDNSTNSPWERLLNDLIVGWVRWQQTTGFLVEQNPGYFSDFWQNELKEALRSNLDFAGIDASLVHPLSPLLLVGAVDVLTGDFRTFKSHRPNETREQEDAPQFVFNDDPKDAISVEAILASAAIPSIFRGVHIGQSVYWDGLYSQNPPVSDLPDASPDEIWVVQINPNKLAENPRPGDEPRTMADIIDRRNELAGNLSLNQELRFIEKINELIGAGFLADSKYRHIEVRRIENPEPLDAATKLDRSPDFIRRMMSRGQREARLFLETMLAM